MNQLLDLLEPDDLLHTDLETVVNACGVEVAKDLLEHCAGGAIYVPKPVSIDLLVERFIQARMNVGVVSVKVLARQLGCSERHVRLLQTRIRDRRR